MGMNRCAVSGEKEKPLLWEKKRKKNLLSLLPRISITHAIQKCLTRERADSQCGECGDIFNARNKWNAGLIVSGYNLGSRQMSA